MKKMMMVLVLAASALALTGCGFNQGCCNSGCSTGCNNASYTYSSDCGTNMCSSSWY